MGTMSIGHWLIVLVVVLLVFGPKRLGDVGKGLGQGLRGLREGLANKDPDPPAPGNNGDRAPDKVESKQNV
jgi:sec-independent protein translocase protein TatA